MPRYYGQQIDPLEMQQMAGNPFYNPELSRPDWYRGIMSVYANLKGAKEEKEAKRISAEDRAWTKWLKEQELALNKQRVTQADREYETPDQRYKREADAALKQHQYRMDEIGKQVESQAKKAEEAQAKSEAATTYAEKVRLANQSAKERIAKRKTFNDVVAQIAATEKRLAELRMKGQAALSKGDAITAQAILAEKERLDSDLATLESMRQSYKNEIISPPPDIQIKRLPADIPGAGPVENKKGRFEFIPGQEFTPPASATKGDRRKVQRGSKALWQRFDGAKWIDE